MQHAATLFLIFTLITFPVLSVATPVISTTSPTQHCMTHTDIQTINEASLHDCCQLFENHCSTNQCDCDSGQFNNSLTGTSTTLLTFAKQADFQQHLSPDFISHLPTSLYRPPRAVL